MTDADTPKPNDKLLGIGIFGLILVIGTVLLVVGSIIGAAVLYLFVNEGEPIESYRAGRISLSSFNATAMKITFEYLIPDTMPSQISFLIERNGNQSSYFYDLPTRSWLVNGSDGAGTGITLAFFDLANDGDIDKGDFTIVLLTHQDDFLVQVLDVEEGYEICRFPNVN